MFSTLFVFLLIWKQCYYHVMVDSDGCCCSKVSCGLSSPTIEHICCKHDYSRRTQSSNIVKTRLGTDSEALLVRRPIVLFKKAQRTRTRPHDPRFRWTPSDGRPYAEGCPRSTTSRLLAHSAVEELDTLGQPIRLCFEMELHEYTMVLM